MAGAVTASAVVVEEATAVSAETNPDVDLSGIMAMGQRSYAPATAMPWRVAASLMARHLMVARPMVGGPTVEGPTVATNTNSRQLLNLGLRVNRKRPERYGSATLLLRAYKRSITFLSLTANRSAAQHRRLSARTPQFLAISAKASAECLLPADRPKN
jgi:hypothetical protein